MDAARFYQKVAIQASGCWLWTQYCDRNGYGRSSSRLAHRVAYELSIGPIPQGMTVDHTCFTAGCVNPDHLRLLGHRENARLQRSASQTHCKNGHEFTDENTYRRPSGRRACRACGVIYTQRYLTKKAGV